MKKDSFPFLSLFFLFSCCCSLLEFGHAERLVDRYRKITPFFKGNWSTPECDPKYPYRTLDGSCNNLKHPTWGQTGTVFHRPEPVNGYVDQKSVWVKSPGRPQTDACGTGSWNGPEYRENVRCVSNLMQSVGENDPFDENNHSLFAYNLAQFTMHDTLQNELLCLGLDAACFESLGFKEPVHPPDVFLPLPNPEDQEPIILINPTIVGVDEFGVTGVVNFVTGWMDLSTVYGKDQETVDGFRAFKDGRLKQLSEDRPDFPPRLSETNTTSDISWPFGSQSTFGCGDQRGFANVVLGAITIVLYREHQRLAGELQKLHPDWSDEILFQEARRMNIAQWQHIALNEVVTEILGSQAGLIPPYNGYREEVNGQASVTYANGVFRAGHSTIDEYVILRDQNGTEIGRIGGGGFMSSVLNAGYISAINFFVKNGVEPIIRGATKQRARKLDHLVIDSLRNLVPPGIFGAGVDIVAQGIHRSRISGTLDYNTARVQWGLPSLYNQGNCHPTDEEYDSLDCFLEVTPLRDLAEKMRYNYRKVSNIDLEFGIVTEGKVPGSTFGPLGGRIIAEQFARMRDGDRFWYENPGVLTPEEYRQVTSMTLKELLLRTTTLQSDELDSLFYV